MLPLLLLILVSSVFCENCSYVFDKQPYSRTSVLTIKGLPTNLVINPVSNELLFTLIDLDTLQDDAVQTKMDQYILKDGVPIIIDNINGQAAAVDENTGTAYIASDDGLHVLDSSNQANFLSFKDEDIVQIFKPRHTKELYSVMYPDNEVFVIDLEKNEKRKVKHVPCAYILAVDNEENVYFECDSKYIKMLLKGFEEPIEFVGIAKNSARAIALDHSSRVVLATNDGLYNLRSDNMIPAKLMDLDFIPSGLAFNGHDIYLSTNGVIFKYSKHQCDCTNCINEAVLK